MLITTAKNLLETIIKGRIKGVTVVRLASEETHAIMARQYPLVSLITNPGSFDDSEARTVRYYDTGVKSFQQRYVRGARVLPILLRCWAAGEEETDEVFSKIIPAIPSQWNYDNFTGAVEIGTEEHSDHTGNVAELYLSVAEIRFKVPVALEDELSPTIKIIEPQGGEFARQE